MSDKHNPRSLKNLVSFDTETGRAAQAKGAETKRKNKDIRDSLKLSMHEFKKMKDELIQDAPDMIDYLKVQWMKAHAAGQNEEAQELAKTIIKYETPELSRVEATNMDISVDKLTEEQLDAQINSFFKT